MSTGYTTVRVTGQHHHWLQVWADRERVSAQEILERAIRLYDERLIAQLLHCLSSALNDLGAAGAKP